MNLSDFCIAFLAYDYARTSDVVILAPYLAMTQARSVAQVGPT